MRILKKQRIEYDENGNPTEVVNEKLEIGEFVYTPDGVPALEIFVRASNETFKKFYLMKGEGTSFKICNISGMGVYAETQPIGDDVLKGIYFSMMCEVILKLSNRFDVQKTDFSRGYSTNAPIEKFLSSCLGYEE